MRFSSREMGVKLTGLECGEESDCGDYTNPICGCTIPSAARPTCKEHEKSHTGGDCREDTQSPEKKAGSRLAGLELLRAQMRESLGGAAR